MKRKGRRNQKKNERKKDSAGWLQAERAMGVPTFLLEYWWMGQKAEEQKVSTGKEVHPSETWLESSVCVRLI